ncbi:FAD-dependent monooxygenase [Streptomyces sp. NBC_00258]|uniref:FAD-dependent monooxygenase n=1 Tax=Streptomyces sp. NBC_00258 TaxID=2903642 RepID=UPI00324392DE
MLRTAQSLPHQGFRRWARPDPAHRSGPATGPDRAARPGGDPAPARHRARVEVRREQEVVGIRQDDHAVTVEVRTTGGVRELGARYLVGCDGAGSNAAGSRASTLPAPTRPSPVGWQWSTWWTRRSRGQDFTTRARRVRARARG